MAANWPAIKAGIEARGYYFDSDSCASADLSRNKGMCQFPFEKDKFFSVLEFVYPDISNEMKEEFWDNYKNKSDHAEYFLPHFDIFTYKSDDAAYLEYINKSFANLLFEKIKKRSLPFDTIFPVKRMTFIDFPTNIPNDPKAYVKAWYNTDDIYKNIYIWGHRKGGTKLEDAYKFPSLLNYFKEYLDHVFSRKLKFSPEYEKAISIWKLKGS